MRRRGQPSFFGNVGGQSSSEPEDPRVVIRICSAVSVSEPTRILRHAYTLNAKALMSPESYQQFNGKPAEDLGPVDLAHVGRQPAIFVGI